MGDLFIMRPNNHFRSGLLDLVQKNFQDKKDLVALEIGSYAGESAQLFLATGKFNKLYCVDPWETGYDNQDPASSTNDKAERVFDSKFSTDNRVCKIKGYSYDVLPQLSDSFFDFIYIDGNHQSEAVRQDILKALPKLKKDGVIAGHDYATPGGAWKGVTNAVDLTLGRKPEFTFIDFSWSIHKYLLGDTTIITPTRNRPEQLSLVIDRINAQTIKPSLWIIADDSDQPLPDFLLSKSQVPIKYLHEPRKYNKSTQYNTARALQATDTEKVIFIDDDDYYPPQYIEKFLPRLYNENTLVGHQNWIDYRLSTCYYRVRYLHTEGYAPGCTFFEWHGSGIRGKRIKQAMTEVLFKFPNGLYNDCVCYRQIFLKGIYSFRTEDFGKDSCVSLKDYGIGNPGAIITHRSNEGMIADPDLKFLKSMLGPDWVYYEKYIGTRC